MKILVTGGAGYIGSLCTKKLIEQNHEVVVIDNLSNSKIDYIDKNAKFYQIDLNENKKLNHIFETENISAVIHFAGYKSVGESTQNPKKYSENITGTINLLNNIVKHNIKQIIYSSSAAVYGTPNTENEITETHSTNPINYYGYTKLCCEDLIKWYSSLYNFNFISLRYFNVAGDRGLNFIDHKAQNVIPIIMEVVFKKREMFEIYGDNFNTRDGTCIRDYIDINDLVNAHILALNQKENHIINLGTSKGTSVKELLDAVEQVTQKKINHKYTQPREGDPAFVVASNQKAKQILNWMPKYNITQMIESTYKVYKNNF
jgi:UDP-glucose 4-epimerase